MNLKRELLGVVKALGDSSVPYALCGGMAVVLHGYPRLTRDIDMLIRPEDLDTARVALAASGFTIAAGIIPFDVGRPHERQVYRVSKAIGAELLTVDLLLLPHFLEEVWQGRETYEVEGSLVHVVSRAGLITPEQMKARSRGVSADMSPQAISARFDILVDLDNTAKALASARFIGKRPRQGESRRSIAAGARPRRTRGH